MTGMTEDRAPAPLHSLRVIEMTEHTEMCARYLADLGAEVVRVEPPEGGHTRTTGPWYGDTSLRERTVNANKSGVTIDTRDAAQRERLLRLLATADIWITTHTHAGLEAAGLSYPDIRARFPSLVIAAVTEFGLTGPYRDCVATEWVHDAMSGVLARSGLPGREPLLPPEDIVAQAAAAQAAWIVLLGYYQRTRTGNGDLLDISLHETVLQVFDPAFGAGPTAGFGRKWTEFPHDRPDVAHYYPVYPCADGYVRICVLSPVQWRALRGWLGEPEQLQDPEYDSIPGRQRADATLRPLISELFACSTAAELTAEGQRRGIPTAPVLELGHLGEVSHYRERGLFTDVELGDSARGLAPRGCFELDDTRVGFERPSPALGEHNSALLDALPPLPEPGPPPTTAGELPLRGLRVLDLGVIVVGAEAGRLFADMGAEVIKVEHSAHPDGSRAPFDGTVSTGFAWGHRGKRSLALDLGARRGVELFERLATQADVVLSNFKPGTLHKLGIDAARLHELNPELVVVESSAFGHTGPWHDWMGYGPLVRAGTGLTALWRDPGVRAGFADAVTVYPDHTVGRIVDLAALAVLLERGQTGRGRRINCAQSDVILTSLSAQLLAESVSPGFARPHGNHGAHDAPRGVFRCAGEDEWCVIDVRGGDDYRRLRSVLELPELDSAAQRIEQRERIDRIVAAWTAHRDPEEVFRVLQGLGVPAGPMRRPAEYRADPALRARRAFGTLHQPTVDEPLPTERHQCLAETIAEPSLDPAPVQGQHTRELGARLLGLPETEIDTLVQQRLLEEPDPWQPLRPKGNAE